MIPVTLFNPYASLMRLVLQQCLSDSEGVVQLLNNSAGALFGRGAGYFEGHSIHDLN